jgi:hypothetical protein
MNNSSIFVPIIITDDPMKVTEHPRVLSLQESLLEIKKKFPQLTLESSLNEVKMMLKDINPCNEQLKACHKIIAIKEYCPDIISAANLLLIMMIENPKHITRPEVILKKDFIKELEEDSCSFVQYFSTRDNYTVLIKAEGFNLINQTLTALCTGKIIIIRQIV